MRTNNRPRPKSPKYKRLIISTDLDATLLTETYEWRAAIPALKALAKREANLVLNSSKTFEEIRALALELHEECGLERSPIVAENGAVIAWPDRSKSEGYRVECLGLNRSTIIERAQALRTEHAVDFEGFADLSVAELMELTGLSETSAQNAMNRQATEPMLWKSSEAEWNAFSAALASVEIKAVRGGQFIHLMGDTDKADGVRATRAHYEQMEPDTEWTVIALGDSPNDAGMLNGADIAVVIQNPNQSSRLTPTAPTCVYPENVGPVAWNEAMLHILQSIN